MKILTLIIKKEFYDQIVSGEKKKEYREITPRTEKRYCVTFPVYMQNRKESLSPICFAKK